ncbi:DUF2075 domain-containing protein [Streptococcus suis]|nr:DUF2075 domain-containing protein [Streptococcus suis]
MAKYTHFFLEIRGSELIGLEQCSLGQHNVLTNGNVIYLYRNRSTKQVYIGQTKHFLTRHKQHYAGQEEKFNQANFDQVLILTSVYFNGSALDDVENQLITYFIADRPKTRKQTVQFDTYEVINGNGGNRVNAYQEREKISSEVILPFWEKVLHPDWVETRTLEELRTRALVKYSPIKQLTDQQSQLIDEIIAHPDKHYLINGDAGTGKTVLLTHLTASLLSQGNNKQIAIIVQPNWIKTAEEIFRVYGMNQSNLTIATSTQLINKRESYDVIIVDEAHKLSRRGSKQLAAFNKVYEYAEFASYENHLQPLLDLGQQVILMYDVLQAIRPANISRTSFQALTQEFEKRYLTTQFRIQAPAGKNYSSEDYINGIKYLLYKDTGLLGQTNFDPNFDRSLFHDSSPDAYFGYFETEPLKELFEWIEEDRNYYPEHINRVLAGLVEPWAQKEGKDPSITHFHEGELKRRWNSTQENWVNSTDEDAEDQIGSVFAVQGIDLNRVGLLIGKDLQVDKDGHLYGDPNHFHNVNGKFTKEELKAPAFQQEFTLFVLNIYYVLLTRGIDGVRIGFWHNPAFKEYFKAVFAIGE